LPYRFLSSLIDAKGSLHLEKSGLLAFAHGHYFALGRHMGHFGFFRAEEQTPDPPLIM